METAKVTRVTASSVNARVDTIDSKLDKLIDWLTRESIKTETVKVKSPKVVKFNPAANHDVVFDGDALSIRNIKLNVDGQELGQDSRLVAASRIASSKNGKEFTKGLYFEYDAEAEQMVPVESYTDADYIVKFSVIRKVDGYTGE